MIKVTVEVEGMQTQALARAPDAAQGPIPDSAAPGEEAAAIARALESGALNGGAAPKLGAALAREPIASSIANSAPASSRAPVSAGPAPEQLTKVQP